MQHELAHGRGSISFAVSDRAPGAAARLLVAKKAGSGDSTPGPAAVWKVGFPFVPPIWTGSTCAVDAEGLMSRRWLYRLGDRVPVDRAGQLGCGDRTGRGNSGRPGSQPTPTDRPCTPLPDGSPARRSPCWGSSCVIGRSARPPYGCGQRKVWPPPPPGDGAGRPLSELAGAIHRHPVAEPVKPPARHEALGVNGTR
jgi:hypothetical protein